MRFATLTAKITSLLGAFVAVAVLMGVLIAGLIVPAAGIAGTAAREGVGLFNELPGELERTALSQRSTIEAADGTLISNPAAENRIIVPLDEVSEDMKEAQVAIEDDRFYDHGGLDARALARAFTSNATSDEVQGGSTLTQQYVKLLLLDGAEDDPEETIRLQARDGMEGYVRKIRELKYAVTLEERMTKDEILEGYLNRSYYGAGAYGIEAAAQRYFGISASDLDLAQSALLAGLVRAPGVTDPINYPEAAVNRRNVVLDRMFELDIIEEGEWRDARDSELELDVQPIESSCASSDYEYFCDYVTGWLLQNPGLGETPDERRELLTTGGLTVSTTLDPEMYEMINEVTAEYTPPGNEYRLASAAALVEPGTGHVLAFGQSSDYSIEESDDGFSETSVNWSVDQEYGGSSGFQIGSVAKAFVLIGALDRGVPIEGNIGIRQAVQVDNNNEWNDPNDPSRRPSGTTRPAVVFNPEDFEEGCTFGADEWVVRNVDDGNHPRVMSVRDATTVSSNTAFASLASMVGTCDVRDVMSDMGLMSGDGDEYGAGERGVPATFVLGADEASPLTVAASYATIAAEGRYCPPVPVTSVVDADGEEIELEMPECHQAIDADVAAGAAELMTGVMGNDGSGYNAVLDDGRPVAGKTGSTDESRDTWFAGVIPQGSLAVWAGSPVERYDGDLRDLSIGPLNISGWLYGSQLPAPMWKVMMEEATDFYDWSPEEFEEPSNRVTYGEDQPVPSVTGMQVEDAIRVLGEAGFAAEEVPASSSQPNGTVVYSSPSEGTPQRTGSTIRIGVAGSNVPPQSSSNNNSSNNNNGGGNNNNSGDEEQPPEDPDQDDGSDNGDGDNGNGDNGDSDNGDSGNGDGDSGDDD